MVLHDQLPSFFRQSGSDFAGWQQCLAFLEERFPEHAVNQEVEQGGCSYTVKLNPPSSIHDSLFMVQFRPARFALSLDIIDAAKRWFGDLAPSVSEIGRFVTKGDGFQLIACRMTYIPGKRFGDIRPPARPLSPAMLLRYRTLLDDLAEFYGRAWKTGMRDHLNREKRCCNGKVGSSISKRLRELENELPSAALRSKARTAKDAVDAGGLDGLPIVFTHGDLLPSNIIVDEHTWRINGLIDWPESEYLPFGISLYGLEHLLGNMSDARFTYLDGAGQLRQYFWQRVADRTPGIEQEDIRNSVELARVVGILLWHGFAWDDGRIDRVVEPIRDADELEYLDAFLGTRVPGSAARL